MTTDAIDATFRETGSAVALRHDADLAPSSLFAAMRPAERIALAGEMADVLKDVLIQKNLIVRFLHKNGSASEHVKAEGWQTCGALCGASARIISTPRIPNGYEARAEAVRLENGVVIGGGEAICTKDEKRWSYADEYAICSMAQTRAISKALRGVLAWVIVLAGYHPTPAEEVPPGGFVDPTGKDSAAQVTRVPQDELLALAASRGLADAAAFGRWCVSEGIAPDLASRKPRNLSDEETVAARERLKAIPPPAPPPAPRRAAEPQSADADAPRMRPSTQGVLFGLLDSRLSTDPATRHAFAADNGVTLPQRNGRPTFSGMAEADAQRIIDLLRTMPDPSDALDAYAAQKGLVI
jgi:hypothetical protein